MGAICSAGFASGDRFVTGHWNDSPLGPMTDVMWARPDGRRVLLAPNPAVADLVTTLYRFDDVAVVPIEATFDGTCLALTAGEVEVTMHAGPGWRIPLGRWRPPWFTRWVEARVAMPLLGVRAYGVGPSGVKQWYRADEYRRVAEARAMVAGVDLGRLEPRLAPVQFGFSGPPRRPSMVRLHSLLVDPSGRLDTVVGPGTRH